jgi:DNA-directed RNA polymerase subunit RPC12/RpoP
VRIRTRHSLFKALIVVGVVTYLVFLYDILLNESAWFIYVMIAFLALIVLALVLYLGRKPDVAEETEAEYAVEALPEEPAEEAVEAEPVPWPGYEAEPAPAPEPEPDETVEIVEEIPKPRTPVPATAIHGPHHYRCPFCSRVFSMEATHLTGRMELRLSCPFCRNRIRVPSQPRMVVGHVPSMPATQHEQAAFTCNECGEVLRFTAAASAIQRMLHVQNCPNCGNARLSRAVVQS